MSTNDPARPPSTRRGFLTASTAALASAGVMALPALASPPDPAEAAFVHWLAVVGYYNGPALANASNEVKDAEWPKVTAAEAAFHALPPSIMSAAAIALVELSYGMMENETPDGLERGASARTILRILACLRPSLHGTVATIAADLLDNPDREKGDSLLSRTLAPGRDA